MSLLCGQNPQKKFQTAKTVGDQASGRRCLTEMEVILKAPQGSSGRRTDDHELVGAPEKAWNDFDGKPHAGQRGGGIVSGRTVSLHDQRLYGGAPRQKRHCL